MSASQNYIVGSRRFRVKVTGCADISPRPLRFTFFCVIAESLRRRFRGKVTGSANISPRPLQFTLFYVIAESLRRRFRGKVTGSANISPRPLAIHLILCYIITILRKTVVQAVYNIYYKSFPKIFQRYFFPLFRRKEYIVIFHKDALEKLAKIHNNKERKLQYNDNFTLFRTGLAISRYGK